MIGLNFLTFALCVFASYRATRLVVVDSIADPVRKPLQRWLQQGESRRARIIGNLLYGGASAVIAGVLTRLILVKIGWIGHEYWVIDGVWARHAAVAAAFWIVGSVVGHRDAVEELSMCRWCVGVWTSVLIGGSLAWWDGWPIVPTGVFMLATAGAQSFLNLAEDLFDTVTEWIRDVNYDETESDD